MDILVSRGGEQFGPYSVEQVNAYLASQVLSPMDWAWREGLEEWVPLAEISGVGEVLPPPRMSSPLESVEVLPSPGEPPAGRDVGGADSTSTRPSRADSEGDPLSLGKAFSFPFQQPDWIQSLWWVVAMGYIPIVDLLLLRGWRVDLTRRMGRSDPMPMPEARDIARFGADGMILWIVSFVYMYIPLTILSILFTMTALAKTLVLIRWAFEKVTGTELTMTLENIMTTFGFSELVGLALPFLYGMVMYPLYRVAMIRFCVIGRLRVFMGFLTNAKLVVRHLRDVMVVFFVDWGLFKLGFGLLGLVLTATGFGALLVPLVVFPMYYWATAYLYGALAVRMRGDLGLVAAS